MFRIREAKIEILELKSERVPEKSGLPEEDCGSELERLRAGGAPSWRGSELEGGRPRGWDRAPSGRPAWRGSCFRGALARATCSRWVYVVAGRLQKERRFASLVLGHP